MNTPLIEPKQVSKRFGDRKAGAGDRVLQRLGLAHPLAVVRAVDGVDLAIQPGGVVGFVDESGCGRLTLGRIAAGLMLSSAGEVRVDSKAIDTLTTNEACAVRLKTQVIFQDPYASLNPHLRVEEIVGEAACVHDLTDRISFADHVATQMQHVDLDPALRDRYSHQFSGDQYRCIGIMRALVVQPSMLVCDEAVAALGMSIQAQILNLFMDLREQLNLIYLLISYDLGVVEHLSDRVVIMCLGRVVELAPTEKVFRRLNHPYTQTLLAEIPRLSARHKMFTVVRGEMPNPLYPPTDCHSHPRCPHVMPHCKTETPTLCGTAVNHTSTRRLNGAT